MKKQFFLILAVLASFFPILAQDETVTYGEWEIFVFWGKFKGEADPILQFNTNQTDVNREIWNYNPLTSEYIWDKQWYPVMFTIPNKDNPPVNIGIHEYLLTCTDTGTLDYRPYMPVAIKEFWKSMYKKTLTGDNLVADLKITDIPDTSHPGSQYWEIEKNLFDGNWDIFIDQIINVYGEDQLNNWKNRDNRKAIMLFLPYFDANEAQGLASYDNLFSYISYREDVLQGTTNVIAHELGHLIYNYPDRGNNAGLYIGKINSESIGARYSSSGPYDLMHMGKGSGGVSQYTLYGITPFHTSDLIATSDNLFSNRHIIINENSLNNKTEVKLKSVRGKIPGTDTETRSVITIPIANTDLSDGDNIDFVENQEFVIEYRNGKGFDNIAALDEDGNSKGILISHIIKSGDPEFKFDKIIDIECAVALPDGSRLPGDAWQNDYETGYPMEILNGNKWYYGMKINDWMDDFAPTTIHSLQGGKSAWWRAPTSTRNQSLPTDFFYDEPGRNAFTPTTRPNTRSWKDNETNIAVFIDEIDEENDYAYLTIYRNYHSVPLTSTNAKTLPDGEKGLSITGDGYIGENFYVGESMHLYLGDKPLGYPDCIPKTTLVPGTNMHVRNNGLIQLKDESILRLENSKLEFREGSKFLPVKIASVELDNSELIFEVGFILIEDIFDSYNITVSGTSSFFNSNLDMIGASVLTVNESSDFTLKSGTNLIMSPLSTFTLKAGSELILEDGVNLVFMDGASVIFETGSKITVEGNAKITGNIQVTDGANISILDESSLTIQQSELTIHSSLKIGATSSLIVENSSILICNDKAIVELSEDAEIRVMSGGTLITNNNSTEKVTFKNNTGLWYSIVGEPGSIISIDDAEIIGARVGICGSPATCSVTNSRFFDCDNGISLVDCSEYDDILQKNIYTINDNYFYGKGVGTGITLTYCSDPIVGNGISNFSEGVKLISSSITLAKNKIVNNINNGLYVTGHGSKPVLVNALTKEAAPELRSFNNEIRDNCLNNPYYNGAQIYLSYSAGVYMTGGCNNVFSGGIGTIPTVPCIKGIINISPDPTVNKVTIAAERNYWGYNSIDYLNQGIFFDLPHTKPIEGEIETGYFIDYEPYGEIPFVEGGIYPISDLSSNEPRSNESILLFNAMKLEQSDNLKPSIKLYELIIKKYPDTPEYFVAITRLPELYIVDERSLVPLISSYDDALDTENISVKKFFKEMKVSTHIKGKNYDTAITLAEEMLAEAESDDERLLSEIDIAIANMMKDAVNNSKGRQNHYSDNLNKLLSLVNVTDSKEEPADFTENVMIPSESKLYQNYPNPFNPVTQIRFALAKTAQVKLSVYNISGQVVADLVNGTKQAGMHSVNFDGSKLNSGVYYYTLETDGKTMTKKMILTK